MPAFATHYLFFNELSDKIANEAQFDFNKDAAAIGTQGPDILFFHRAIPFLMHGKPLRKVGSALHRAKPSKIFDTMAQYCKTSNEPDIAKSYAYGFIMHYALDRTCHPYVYAQQEKILSVKKHLHKSSAHNIVELSADSFMLSKRANIREVYEFDAAQTITQDKRVISEISKMLSYIIKEVLCNDVAPQQIIQAISDTARCQEILRDKSGNICTTAHIAESIFGSVTGYFKISALIKPKDLEIAQKYVNIERTTWRSPYDNTITRNESFEDLFDFAKSDAIRLIDGFEDVLRCVANSAQVTNNISFLTGTEVL